MTTEDLSSDVRTSGAMAIPRGLRNRADTIERSGEADPVDHSRVSPSVFGRWRCSQWQILQPDR